MLMNTLYSYHNHVYGTILKVLSKSLIRLIYLMNIYQEIIISLYSINFPAYICYF